MKKVLKVACQKAHSSLKLNQLSRNESNGVMKRLTRFKLMRYSLHELPFSLSRSIRGVGPQYKYNDVLHKCFQDGEISFDAALFRETMNRELKSEVIREIADYNTFIAERFHKYPAWSSVLPWDNLSCDEMCQVYLIWYTKIDRSLRRVIKFFMVIILIRRPSQKLTSHNTKSYGIQS